MITQEEIKRCSDRSLQRSTPSGQYPIAYRQDLVSGPCVAFCDTATVIEKVSIVVLADASRIDGGSLWERVYVPWMSYWEPTKMPGRIIDERAVEAEIKECIKACTGLRVLYVDTRGNPWAVAMVSRLRKVSPHFQKIVKSWRKTEDESEQGWIDLEIRYRQRTIRHPYDEAIFKEAKGLVRRKKGDRLIIDDLNRSKSHKDILESIAMCCHLVIRESSIKRERIRLEDVKAKLGTNTTANLLNRIGRTGHAKIGDF